MNIRRAAVRSSAWLDDTGVQPLFKEIMSFGNQLSFFWRQVITAKSLHVFQRVEKLEFLICWRNPPRIRAQDEPERLECASLAPTINERIERLEQVELHRMRRR